MIIDLSALKKDVLVSLKQCCFKKMTFTGNISYENLNGPVFENCFLKDVISRMCPLLALIK